MDVRGGLRVAYSNQKWINLNLLFENSPVRDVTQLYWNHTKTHKLKLKMFSKYFRFPSVLINSRIMFFCYKTSSGISYCVRTDMGMCLGAALLCSFRAGSDLGLVSRWGWELCQLGSSSQARTRCGPWQGNRLGFRIMFI